MKLQVDVMADSSCLKWVPTMSHFFRQSTEFERFTINFNFRNITEQELSPLNLTNYSFHIESNGRARDMFMFTMWDKASMSPPMPKYTSWTKNM